MKKNCNETNRFNTTQKDRIYHWYESVNMDGTKQDQ